MRALLIALALALASPGCTTIDPITGESIRDYDTPARVAFAVSALLEEASLDPEITDAGVRQVLADAAVASQAVGHAIMGVGAGSQSDATLVDKMDAFLAVIQQIGPLLEQYQDRALSESEYKTVIIVTRYLTRAGALFRAVQAFTAPEPGPVPMLIDM